MRISRENYLPLFYGDLSEYAEIFLRHAGIYVETTAVVTDSAADVVYATRVCRLENTDITTLLQHGSLEADDMEELEYHRHDTIEELHAFYAEVNTRFMTPASV